MRTNLFLILLTTVLLSSCTKEQTQPNILFVFADQLRSQELSCYGGTNIQTPNMDRLAEEGLIMTNAISTYPVCSPFRGMMLTGLYPMRNGMTNNDHHLRSNVTSFAEVCNNAGYQTAYIGKWHLDGFGRETYIPPERREGFHFFQSLECTHDYFNSKYYDNNSRELKIWEGYDADAQTEAAKNYILNRNKEQPFFMMLSWGPPHSPYIAPKKYMDMVDPDKIKLRPNVNERIIADELHNNPRFEIPEYQKEYREKKLIDIEDETKIRKMSAGYLAGTLSIDHYLGDLMKLLEKEGILDNTIIVFTSDHGDHLFSHRLTNGKSTPFEEAISIPFLVRYPKKIPTKTVSDALIAPIDMMPTVLGLAGEDCPEVDGKDLSRVVVKKEDDTRDAVLIMSMTHFHVAAIVNGVDNWRGVRTKKYTYARYEDQTAWLLYDNIEDPFQMNNLVEKTEYVDLINELNTKLDALLKEAGDAEDTKSLYDLIIKENPDRFLLNDFREANPGNIRM